MAKLFRRSDVALMLDSTNTYYIPISSGSVTLYDVGAVVDAAQAGVTSVTVLPGHGFAVTDYFLYCASISNISTTRVFDVSSVTDGATQCTLGFAGATASFAIGSYLLNLGADAGGAYTGSTMTTYANPDTAFTANTNATVTTSTSGSFEYWWNGEPGWELVRLSNGTPVAINFVPRSDDGGATWGVLIATANTVVPRGHFHTVENAASINTITGTGCHVGFPLYLKVATGGSATLTNTTGNLRLGASRTLNNNDVCHLVYDGTNWIEVAYADVA